MNNSTPFNVAFSRDKLLIFSFGFGIAILGCLFNGIILYLTHRYIQFHTPFMYVRAAYASLDFISSALSVAVSLLRYFYNGDFDRIACWISTIGLGVFFATIQMTAFIAIERYVYFCKPMSYPRYFTAKSIAIFTCSFCIIGEAYTVGTELLIGRVTHRYFNVCQLPGQRSQGLFQFCIFFAPAIACTLFSIRKIKQLMKEKRAFESVKDIEPILRKKAGKMALR